MQLNITLFALTTLAIVPAAQAICCIYGSPGVCRRSDHGRIYAADTYIPASLQERDVVVPFAVELDKRACCCSAGNADQCATICD
jgi:hypothetical protein